MNILEAYKFCPICGKPALERKSSHSLVCNNCGHSVYLNPTIGAVALITDDQNQVLFVRRSKEPAKGKWHLPGGFTEVGETIENAVAREVKEELNLDVEVQEYLFSIPNRYEYKEIEKYPLDFFFKCKIVNISTLNVDLSENSEYAFLSADEIKMEDIGLPSIKEGIRRYFNK